MENGTRRGCKMVDKEAHTPKRICPFCKEEIKAVYFRRYGWHVYGCRNKKCAIKPTTRCYATEREAREAWDNAFVV